MAVGQRIKLGWPGIVPSFKNSKLIVTKNRRGKPLRRPLVITKPEYQEAMKDMAECFQYQLVSIIPTNADGTLMEP